MQYSHSFDILFQIAHHEVVVISSNKDNFIRVRIAFYNHKIFRYILMVQEYQ